MNKDPQKATKWKGRILIGVEHYETEGPQLGVEPMSRLPPKDEDGNEIEGAKSIVEIAEEYIAKGNQITYKLMYEFNSVINIPEKLGKFNLQLCIGEHTWTSDGSDSKRAVGYNYNRWNQRSDEIEFKMPYEHVEDIEDIFLYLCPDKGGLGGLFGGKDENKKVGKPVSYIKLKASDFTEENPALRWVEMKEEPVEDEIDSPELAGVVGFRLSIARSDAVNEEGQPITFKDKEKWKRRMKRRPDSTKIRCYLF